MLKNVCKGLKLDFLETTDNLQLRNKNEQFIL